MKIETRHPLDLELHPYLEDQPRLAEHSEEFKALVASIEERGLDYPLVINGENQVLDGRHRLLAAKSLGWESIEVVVRTDAGPAEIIVETILQRRHYTKGALAYLVLPLIRTFIDTGRERRLANLKKGKNPNETPKRTECTGEDSLDGVAARIGVSSRLLDQAVELRRIFKRDRLYKETNEPRLLAGEVGLGALIAGYGGRISVKGKDKPHSSQLELFTDGVDVLIKRFDYWTSLRQGHRAEFRATLQKRLAGMPAARRQQLAEWFSEMAKTIRKADPN